MTGRRDEVQAERFVAGRALAAVLGGDPDATGLPVRRHRLTALAGAVLAVLGVLGAAGYRLARPAPSAAWRAAGAIVVEDPSGALFVRQGGVLHPVANYPSALLAASRSGRPPTVVHVDRRVLAHVPLGERIGIAGAPASLPDPRDLVRGPVTVCSGPSAAGGAAAVTVTIGATADAVPLAPGGAVLVRAGRSLVLLADGRRRAIDELTAATLGLDVARAVPVSPAFLATLPAAVPSAAPLSAAPPASVTGSVCAIVSGAGPPRLALGTSDSQSSGGVSVKDGGTALVSDPTASSTAILITGGRRFAVPDAQALVDLGYAGTPEVPVPTAVLALIPAGPALTVPAARAPAP